MSYGQRAGSSAPCPIALLVANRARYEDIAIANSGNTKNDAAIDIDGGIGTLKYYARLGSGRGEARMLLDEKPVRLAKAENYQAVHVLLPRRGVAVHINAFNFPSWGLWEKAAVSLLAGIPVFAKPASATALLAHAMVKDVIEAKVLPEGALSLLCGTAGDLLSVLASDDVVAFTGSAETAARVRGDPNVIARNVPVNIEADSINAALLAPGAAAGSAAYDAFLREVVREMTVKAGQKCTAIRRIFVPREQADAVTDALADKLNAIKVGDPRDAETRMGPLVTRSQQRAARECSGWWRTSIVAAVMRRGFGSTRRNRHSLLPRSRAKEGAAAKAVHEVKYSPPAANRALPRLDDPLCPGREGLAGGFRLRGGWGLPVTRGWRARCRSWRILAIDSRNRDRSHRAWHCHAAVQSWRPGRGRGRGARRRHGLRAIISGWRCRVRGDQH
jgi:3,4-dehydroadipyl-CoA semialdehyde dehydrogenase